VPVTATRQVTGWVWPKRPELFEVGALPVWAIDNPDDSIHYGFPLTQPGGSVSGDTAVNGIGGVGLKVAHHRRAEAVDPADPGYEARPGDEATFRSVLTRHLPDADGPVLAMRVCMYANSPDLHFIVDTHPFHANVVVACGFSGHGFKFASVIGEVLADLATDGKTPHPVGFLSLKRFGGAPDASSASRPAR
jgi:sarcosine oxidase